MPLPVLLDWLYATFAENMSKEAREDFDYALDSVLNRKERARAEREARLQIARLNAR